jgi:Flp pilus assembly pilin Flp
VKRGPGYIRVKKDARGKKKDRWDERGASLVEYALVLSLVAVVAIGALVYLGRSVSNTVNTVAVAVTPDPVITPDPAPVTLPAGVSCLLAGTKLTGICNGPNAYAWLDGMYYFPPPSGPWKSITSANDQQVFLLAVQTAPPSWTCSVSSGNACTRIATPPPNNPPVAYELGS